MRALSFPVCLLAGIIASLVLSYATVFGLTGFELHRQLAAADQHNYRDLADNLRQDIGPLLTLGPADKLTQTGDLLQQYGQFDKDILGISVFSPMRVDISDTDPWRIGTLAPTGWLPPNSSGPDWQSTSATETRLGFSLRDDNGKPAGVLMLRYAPDNAPMINAALLRMTQTGLPILALTALLALALVLLLARRPHRDISRVIAALSSASASIPPSAMPPELRPLLQAKDAAVARIEGGIHDLTRMGISLDSKAE